MHPGSLRILGMLSEPRGLSVLWYSLLVVGMRILPHLAPGGPPQRVGYGWTLDYEIAS